MMTGLKLYPDDVTFPKHSAISLFANCLSKEQEVQRWNVAVGLCVFISAH